LEDISSHLNIIQEKPLAESLSHGIGYYHEALNKNNKRIVESLFEGGAFKVLLGSRDVA